MSEVKLDQVLVNDGPGNSRVETRPRGVIPTEEFAPGLLKAPVITSPAADAAGVAAAAGLDIVTAKSPATLVCLLGLAADQAAIGAAADVPFATKVAGAIVAAAGEITIPAGIRARITASLHVSVASAEGSVGYAIVDADNVAIATGKAGVINTAGSTLKGVGSPAIAIVGPFAVDTVVKVRVTAPIAAETFTIEADNTWCLVEQIGGTALDYVHAATQVQLRLAETGVEVFDSGTLEPVEALKVDIEPALVAATDYEVRARHLSAQGMWSDWSEWQTFTTA